MVLVCPACGTENRAVAKFCIECIGVLPTGFATTDISPRLDVPPVPSRDARASSPPVPPRAITQPTPVAASVRRAPTERLGSSGTALDSDGAPVPIPPEIESRRGLWVSVAAFAIALCVGAAGWMIAGAGGWYIYSSANTGGGAATPATIPVVEGLVAAPAASAASMSVAASRPLPGASAAMAATAAALVPIEAAAPPTGAPNGGSAAAPAGSAGAVAGAAPSAAGAGQQRTPANAPAAQGSGSSATATAQAPAAIPAPTASGSRRAAPKARPAVAPDARPEAAAPARPGAVASGAPSAQCAGLGFFATSRCMAAQCLVANFRAHPECEAVRQQQRLMEEKRNPANFN
ncbi:MAG: zinc ribbon domain-containing protein [Comamonadaceae bacterium]|nr:MAG: zinc ribbon domain-containing protein [Comamonadaceae bacterium]